MTRATASGVSRYHPLLVALHWIVALMAAASLVGGLTLLQATPNSDPMKPIYLQGHMAGGLVLGALMLLRLVTRLTTARPGPAAGRTQHAAAQAVHWALYLVMFAMIVTGIGMAALGGLWPILSGGTVALPPSFSVLPPHAGHELFARLLIGLIALHLAAALWHGLSGHRVWGRMWFGRRSA
jgi:cytochrome b561